MLSKYQIEYNKISSIGKTRYDTRHYSGNSYCSRQTQ